MTYQTIKASEGCWLTNAADTPIDRRVFAKEIHLGSQADPDSYVEISQSQFEQYQNELDNGSEEATA